MRDRSLDGRVFEGEHAAAGVLDDEDLLGPQQSLADHQGADGVVRGETARVPDDVGIAGPEAEDVFDRQTSVHAGEDRQLAGRRQLQVRPVE